MSKELLQKGLLNEETKKQFRRDIPGWKVGRLLRKSLLNISGRKLRKRFAKGLAAICTAVLAVTQFGPMEAKAADDYETTYKVMIYSGDKGTFNGTGCVSGAGEASLSGADTIVVSGLHYGDTISINVSSTNGAINLNPEDGGKYQPTGTRRSGRDNSEAFDKENMTSPSRIYTVTSDRTFVVTYGVPGKMVPYTVSYVLAGTTNPVPGSKAQTFYGVAGEKPVVSAPYFEGYTPVYKAITGTLKRGQENAWVFEYTRNVEQTTTEPATPQAPQQGEDQTGTTTTPGTTDNEATGTTPGTDNEGTGTNPETNEEGTNEGDTTALEEEETPGGLLDLDDEEVPAGNLNLSDSEKDNKEDAAEASHFPVFVGIGIAAVILLLALIGVLIKRRKSL
ncbi:hypothetical protein ABXS75_16485 [Roseburia hominis]